MPKKGATKRPRTALESKTFRDGAIYLFKRNDYKKPTWFCRVKVPGAKGYISQSTKTTDEHLAFKFADDLFHKGLVQVANGQELNSRKTSLAIKEFIESYSEAEKNKPTTINRIKFLNHIAQFIGPKRLKEIHTKELSELNDWIIDNSKTGSLSPNTIKRYSVDIKQFFNWCLERSYIDRAPRFPKIKTESNRRPHFNHKDWEKLIKHLEYFVKTKVPAVGRDRLLLRDYILILADTGIRVGEARQLKWKDIKVIQQEIGNNKFSNIVLSVSGKTGTRQVVSRTPEIKQYFKRIFELRTTELGKKPDSNDYIFCGKDGKPIGSFKRAFTTLIKEANVETDEQGNRRTLYSLRHTYATISLQEGVHQFVLAKNMGTSVAMLEKHYGHTSSIASAAELTKGSRLKEENQINSLNWMME